MPEAETVPEPMSVDAAIRYAEGLDSAYSSRLRGATTQEVGHLERLTGRTLPKSFKEFLSRMGQSDAGLRVHPDGSSAIGTIIGIYQRFSGRPNTVIPHGCILMGMGGSWELALDMARPEDPAVVISIDGRVDRKLADSLTHLLFRRAFQRFRLERAAHRRSFSASTPAPAPAALLEGLGFKLLPFSDSTVACAEREGAAIQAETRAGRCLVKAGLADPTGFGELRLALEKALGAGVEETNA